ncbi:F-box protein At4g09920-like [Carex rostrata]
MMNIKAHGSEENDIIDRISSLPDDVLTHILSFLSTRNAVQTCILSKRWINTWAFVPDMEFDIKEFGLPKFIDDNIAVESVTKFELLVKNALDKREISHVKRFRLWLDYKVFWPRTQAIFDCIGDVMKLRPRECLVEMGSSENLNLNNDLIFTRASLIYLQLWIFTKLINPLVALELNSVNLPCLKSLVLFGVTINDNSFKTLLLGCPLLEELTLKHCDIGIIEICSNTLKKLEIMLLNMSSLIDASIYNLRWYDEDKYVTRGPKLIQSLSNVKSLRLQFVCLKGEVQKKDFSNCPVFINLQHLELVLEMELLDEETTTEEPRDTLVQREFLKTVRIVGYKTDDGFVDQLINKLLVHVKIIGNIIIDLEDI